MEVPGYDRPIPFGFIENFFYRIEGDDGLTIHIATTRLETMLGDTAVAVHPKDTRYQVECRHPPTHARLLRGLIARCLSRDTPPGFLLLIFSSLLC